MHSNGIDHHYNDKRLFHAKPNQRLSLKFLHKIQINEWTFSLFLFIVSLTIVIGKLILIYGDDIPSTFENNLSSFTAIKKQLHNVYDIPNALVMIESYNNKNNQYANETYNLRRINEYKKVIVRTTIKISNKYGWLLKATMSGLGILGFTWFIVYKDSNIPGINPPSPFSPPKKKLPDNSRIQINYLIGIINGILIFIYMSFQ